jgi:hypothetical protein
MTRGLLATVYLPLAKSITEEEAHELYAKRYEGEPFVTVLPAGVLPQTGWVEGSNRAQVGVKLSESGDVLIAFCAIDSVDIMMQSIMAIADRMVVFTDFFMFFGIMRAIIDYICILSYTALGFLAAKNRKNRLNNENLFSICTRC